MKEKYLNLFHFLFYFLLLSVPSICQVSSYKPLINCTGITEISQRLDLKVAWGIKPKTSWSTLSAVCSSVKTENSERRLREGWRGIQGWIKQGNIWLSVCVWFTHSLSVITSFWIHAWAQVHTQAHTNRDDMESYFNLNLLVSLMSKP